MNALPAFCDTHISVHEIFHLDARLLAKERELRKGHLAADDDARNAVFLEFINGIYTVRVHHDGCMKGNRQAEVMNDLEDSEILNEDSIRANFF